MHCWFRRLVVSFAITYASVQTVTLEAPSTCPVTQPPEPAYIPPAPYPWRPPADGFYFGSDRLWVQLPKHPWKGYRQKLQWWSAGYDWAAKPDVKLRITGRRLDAPAPSLEARANPSGMRGQAFFMSGLAFPTEGCWEITGQLEDARVTFVVWVNQGAPADVQLQLWASIQRALLAENGEKYFHESFEGAMIPGGVNGLTTFAATVMTVQSTGGLPVLIVSPGDKSTPEMILRVTDDQGDLARFERMARSGSHVSFKGIPIAFSKRPFTVTFAVRIGDLMFNEAVVP